MNHRDKLDEIFRAVAGQMQVDFQATRSLVRHKGLKGKAAENNLVATFLGRYLPATLTIRQNAEVVSSAGDVSFECDVLICDPSTPPLWSANDVDCACRVLARLDRGQVCAQASRPAGLRRGRGCVILRR